MIALRIEYREAERAGPVSLGRWFVGLGAMVVAWWGAIFLAQWTLWVELPSAAGMLVLELAVLAALYRLGKRHLSGTTSRWGSVPVFGVSVAIHALMFSMLLARPYRRLSQRCDFGGRLIVASPRPMPFSFCSPSSLVSRLTPPFLAFQCARWASSQISSARKKPAR